MNTAQWTVRAGPPCDHPGCWIVSGMNAANGESWAFFRKQDGTYWEIAREVYFPPSGGTLRVELGNHVMDEARLRRLREYYMEWMQANYRVEIFDCAEQGFRNFADRQSANQYRDSLMHGGVKDANIRIVAINRDGGLKE